MKKGNLFLVTMVAVILVAGFMMAGKSKAAEESAASWGPLQFLVGTWGAGEGGKAEASTYSFATEFKGHVLVRRCLSGCDAGPMGADYKDILYVYTAAPGQPYKAIFFDSEGHVVQYDVTSPSANTAIFLSDGSTPGPRFRLSYSLAGQKMSGKFEMLPPGGGDARQLSEWSGGKK